MSVTLAVTVTAWLSGFMFVAPSAQAQSLADQIAALQAQIAALTAQLNALVVQSGGQTTTAGVLTKNLSQGMRDAEVSTLQSGLASDPTVYPEGLVTGYFGPLTRAAVIRYQEKYASEILASVGLSAGTGFVGPSTRAKFNAQYGGAVSGGTPGQPPVVVGSGQIGVYLAPNTPAASVAPAGASNVPFLAVNLTAPATGAVRVDSMIVHRTGVGASTDFDNVYLYEGNTRLTTGRSVNSSTNNAEFHSLNLTVPAGTTRTILVTADTASAAAAGNVNAFELVSASSVVGSGPVAGTFPIRGNNISIAAASAGTITIDTPVDGSNPKVGETNVKIGSFRVTVGAAEDVELRRIAFFQAGSISRAGLSNLRLNYLGQTLATVSGLDSRDLAVFALATPFLIEKGNSRTFEIWADIGSSTKNNDTVKFYIDENTDVYAVGRTYGHGAAVTATALDGTTADTEEVDVTVQGGQVTITFNGPAAKDIAPDAEDVELYNFTLTSQANIEVREMLIRLTGSETNAFDDIKVYNVTKGIVVMGPTDTSTSASTTNITYSDRFTMNAGESNVFSIRADLAASGAVGVIDGNTIQVDLGQGATAPFGASAIRNLDNNQFITDIVPSGVVTGNTHTIRTTSLTLTLAGTPTSQTYVRGTANVDLVGFNFKASTAQDITITSMNVTVLGDDDTSGVFVAGQLTSTSSVADRVSSVWLVDQSSGTTLAGPESVNTTTGVAQFSGVNYTVPAGQTKTIVVRTNLNSSALSNANADRIKVEIEATTDVTARDPQGNTVNPGTADPNGTTADSGTRVTIADTGSMTVVKAPDDTESEIGLVVAGKSNVTLAKFRFTATNEALRVDKVEFRTGAENIDEITGLSVWDGATQIGSAITPSLSGSTSVASFNFAGNGFVVPKDGSKTITVKGNLNTVTGGADSGTSTTITLSALNFEAKGTGVGSNTTLTSFGGEVSGNAKHVRKTVPTVSFTGGDSVLTAGEKVLMKFTVAADSAEQVSLYQFRFSITTTNASFSATANQMRIRESGNILTSTSTQTVTETAGGQTVSATTTLTNMDTIPAGGSKTYEILGTVSSVGSGSASLTIQMPQSTAQEATVPAAAGAICNVATSIGFCWSDNSVIGGPALGNADWYNDFKVKTLPSSTYVLTKT